MIAALTPAGSTLDDGFDPAAPTGGMETPTGGTDLRALVVAADAGSTEPDPASLGLAELDCLRRAVKGEGKDPK